MLWECCDNTVSRSKCQYCDYIVAILPQHCSNAVAIMVTNVEINHIIMFEQCYMSVGWIFVPNSEIQQTITFRKPSFIDILVVSAVLCRNSHNVVEMYKHWILTKFPILWRHCDYVICYHNIVTVVYCCWWPTLKSDQTTMSIQQCVKILAMLVVNIVLKMSFLVYR